MSAILPENVCKTSKLTRAGYWGNLYIAHVAVHCNVPNEYCDTYCNIFIQIFQETKTKFNQALRHFIRLPSSDRIVISLDTLPGVFFLFFSLVSCFFL